MKIPIPRTTIGSCGGSIRDYLKQILEDNPNTIFRVGYNSANLLTDPIVINENIIYFRIFRNREKRTCVCIPDNTITETVIIKVPDAEWEEDWDYYPNYYKPMPPVPTTRLFF
jgi:hypothetical protein